VPSAMSPIVSKRWRARRKQVRLLPIHAVAGRPRPDNSPPRATAHQPGPLPAPAPMGQDPGQWAKASTRSRPLGRQQPLARSGKWPAAPLLTDDRGRQLNQLARSRRQQRIAAPAISGSRARRAEDQSSPGRRSGGAWRGSGQKTSNNSSRPPTGVASAAPSTRTRSARRGGWPRDAQPGSEGSSRR